MAPSATSGVWIDAIRAALLREGYKPGATGEYTRVGNEGPERVVVTTEVTDEELARDARWAVLMPTTTATPFALAGADLQHLIQYARNASAILAPLADLPSNSTILTETELSERVSVEILPGVWADVPPAPPPLPDVKDSEAVIAAMRLYELRPKTAAAPVEWPPEFFLTTESKTVEADGLKIIDLTGSPRPVVWGPHFYMPSGRWEIRLRFAVDQNASGRAFSFEWGDLSDYTSLKATPGVAGVYEVVLEHEWTKPSVAEMRISVTEGVFDGTLTFGGATVALAS